MMDDNNTISNATLTIHTARRHVAWFWLFVSAIVTLIAIVKSFGDTDFADLSNQPSSTVWSVSAISIIVILSCTATVSPFFTELLSGTGTELILSFITCAMSAASLPTIMDPSNGLAIKDDGTGNLNANLYFFSWSTFLLSLFVFGDFINEMRGVPIISTHWFPVYWIALTTTSLVTMFVAGRAFSDHGCMLDSNQYGVYCQRTKLGIALGGVSGFICAGWMLVSFCLSSEQIKKNVDIVLTIILLVGWCFGVGLLTFGNNSPGSDVGNLYFFSWSSFILAVFLAMNAIVERLKDSQSISSSSSTTEDLPAIRVITTTKMNRNDEEEAVRATDSGEETD